MDSINMQQLRELHYVMRGMREASRFLLHLRQSKKPVYVRNKPDGPVSEADLGVQQILSAFLIQFTPQIPLVSEEQEIDWRKFAESHEMFWLLDPLDGTVSFLQGEDEYGIQLALVRHSVVVGAWIICPSLGWHAFGWSLGSRNRHLGLKGEVVTTNQCNEYQHTMASIRAVLALGDFPEKWRRRVLHLAPKLRDWRGTKSCAVDYLELILGHKDLLLYKRTLPWDHAPGVYLAEQFGASAFRHDLKPYRLSDGEGGLIVVREQKLLNFVEVLL